MQKSLDHLYRISKLDTKYISKLFERVFFNWPVAIALIPDEEIRRTKAHFFYSVSIKHLIKYGEAYAPSPKIEGVAMWVHTDYYDLSTWQMIKFGALKAIFKLGTKTLKRAEMWMEFVEKNNSELTEEPHYHLVWLGVEPRLQNKGIGTDLMNSMLNKFSKEKMKCSLDTQEKRNVDYYKRFGFKVIRECQYPHADITYWGMLWEPEK